MKKAFHSPALAAVILILLYFALSIPVAIIHPLFLHHWLVWNVFLALLPPLFAGLLMHTKQKWLQAALFFLWFSFFPNAPYLVTDLIHIVYLDFSSQNLYAWLTLFQIGMALFLASILGLWSLQVIHGSFQKAFGKLIGWGVVLISCIACGYAVYIGRFIRFNSWDIFIAPLTILKTIFSKTNLFALQFSGAFAAYLLFIYSVFYTF